MKRMSESYRYDTFTFLLHWLILFFFCWPKLTSAIHSASYSSTHSHAGLFRACILQKKTLHFSTAFVVDFFFLFYDFSIKRVKDFWFSKSFRKIFLCQKGPQSFVTKYWLSFWLLFIGVYRAYLCISYFFIFGSCCKAFICMCLWLLHSAVCCIIT